MTRPTLGRLRAAEVDLRRHSASAARHELRELMTEQGWSEIAVDVADASSVRGVRDAESGDQIDPDDVDAGIVDDLSWLLGNLPPRTFRRADGDLVVSATELVPSVSTPDTALARFVVGLNTAQVVSDVLRDSAVSGFLAAWDAHAINSPYLHVNVSDGGDARTLTLGRTLVVDDESIVLSEDFDPVDRYHGDKAAGPDHPWLVLQHATQHLPVEMLSDVAAAVVENTDVGGWDYFLPIAGMRDWYSRSLGN